MKVKITKDFPPFEEGKSYEVSDQIGKMLVEQGHGVKTTKAATAISDPPGKVDRTHRSISGKLKK